MSPALPLQPYPVSCSSAHGGSLHVYAYHLQTSPLDYKRLGSSAPWPKRWGGLRWGLRRCGKPQEPPWGRPGRGGGGGGGGRSRAYSPCPGESKRECFPKVPGGGSRAPNGSLSRTAEGLRASLCIGHSTIVAVCIPCRQVRMQTLHSQ
jgi:hypothetical protein